MRDKTHYSFLIAFSRQLESALTDDVDDDVADAVERLGACLGPLLSIGCDGDGEVAGDDDDGVEADDPSGDGPPLGGDLPMRPSASAPHTVERTRRLIGGGTAQTQPGTGLVLGSRRRRSPVLKGGKRRGKK